jgi:DNA-binding LytR/AlgR family response regulator
MQKVLVNEILYVESRRDYVKIFLTTGKSFLAKQSISSMVNLLSEQSFLRVHRSFLVSVHKITGYDSNDIQLGSIEIPIGKLFKQHVMETINSR